jgi:hypothetical protein
MAHFAKIDDQNTVLEVIVVNNDDIDNLSFPESEPVGIAFCRSLFGEETNWLQTSYNGNFRYRYAGVGSTFDAAAQVFIPPKPYPSWLLNTNTYTWKAPVPYPTDGKRYYWDEATLSWILVEPNL